MWQVFDKYMQFLKADRVFDIDSAMFIVKSMLEKNPISDIYPCVIVDEGQDFSTNSFSVLRAIAGEEHENDLFIVGDAHQRIYKRKAVLSKCGINIKGRSSHLRLNYRTTEEIRKYAYSVLTGLSFDNLDGELDERCESRSFTHGIPPVINNFASCSEESEYIIKEINNLVRQGVNTSDICIVARTNKLLDNYKNTLSSNGLRCFELKTSKTDERSIEGIRISTMHRIKGLEFQYVFIVSANEGIIPFNPAIDYSDKVTERETIKAEKCLIYVALTRAQKCVYVTSYGKQSKYLPKI